MNSALVGRNTSELGKLHYRNSSPGGKTRGPRFRGVVCYYYHKLGHMIQDCKQLRIGSVCSYGLH